MSKTSGSNKGLGFFGLLAIVFIVMKLACIGTVCNWSWLWVLAPIWGGIVLAIIAIVVAVLVIKD